MELLISMAMTTLVLAIIMVLYLFGLRSFGAMSNYAQMSSKSRMALDTMARDIRQATIVVGFNPNLPVKSLQLATYDMNGACNVTYSWDSNARVLTCARSYNGNPATTTTNLTGCDAWNFFLFQRTPTNNYVFYPTTNPKLCKLINMSWKCSRTILGKKVNTEDVMTAEVVLRNMNVIISN
jgi:Tfp pilus assembly protein PilW